MRRCSTSFVIREILIKNYMLKRLEFLRLPILSIGKDRIIHCPGTDGFRGTWRNTGELWVCCKNTAEFNISAVDRHLGCCQFGLWQLQWLPLRLFLKEEFASSSCSECDSAETCKLLRGSLELQMVPVFSQSSLYCVRNKERIWRLGHFYLLCRSVQMKNICFRVPNKMA